MATLQKWRGTSVGALRAHWGLFSYSWQRHYFFLPLSYPSFLSFFHLSTLFVWARAPQLQPRLSQNSEQPHNLPASTSPMMKLWVSVTTSNSIHLFPLTSCHKLVPCGHIYINDLQSLSWPHQFQSSFNCLWTLYTNFFSVQRTQPVCMINVFSDFRHSQIEIFLSTHYFPSKIKQEACGSALWPRS